MKKIFFVVFSFTFLFCAQYALAEKISKFESSITINKDATVDVEENIVYDFGNAQKHGVFRTIPIKYSTDVGLRTIEITDVEVLVDGNKGDYKVKKESRDLEIKIGNPNEIVTGKHVYEIRYSVKGALNYFEDYDEFYWNVTGSGWPVDITSVVARVDAPSIIRSKCFQGDYGNVRECLIGSRSDRSILFNFNTVVSGEDSTIVIGLEKGAVDKPTFAQKWLWFLRDNWILLMPVFVFGWSFNRWWKYGRDPEGRGTIVPYYDVPDNLSVAQASAVLYNGLRSKDISAMIIQLAVKGFIKIKQQKIGKIFKHTQYTFIKTSQHSEKNTQLSTEEQLLLESLFIFGENGQVTTDNLKEKFYKKVSELQKKTLEQIKNKGYLPQKIKLDGIVYVILIAVAIAFSSFFLGTVAIISGVVIFIIVVFFAVIMGHRTKKGVLVREKLLGLKMYLEVAEKDRIKFHNAPEKNPQQFEKLLPYAMLLGVEEEWAEQFKDIYKEQPEWYEGDNTQAFNSVVLANSLNSFASTTSSTVISAPSSASSGSSGFSGGGSGGGFGGGGGGSW